MDKFQFWSFLIVHLRGDSFGSYFNLARNCNYGFSDGITLRCYYMKKHWHPDGHLWTHIMLKVHWDQFAFTGSTLDPCQAGSQPLCFPLLTLPLAKVFVFVPGSFSISFTFSRLCSHSFSYLNSSHSLLKLCLNGQNRSPFSFKLSLTVPSCSDFKLHNPIMCHFFISFDCAHLLGAECRITASQRCLHPNAQNLKDVELHSKALRLQMALKL